MVKVARYCPYDSVLVTKLQREAFTPEEAREVLVTSPYPPDPLFFSRRKVYVGVTDIPPESLYAYARVIFPAG